MSTGGRTAARTSTSPSRSAPRTLPGRSPGCWSSGRSARAMPRGSWKSSGRDAPAAAAGASLPLLFQDPLGMALALLPELQQPGDRPGKVLGAERLGDVLVRAAVLPPVDILLPALRGEPDYRHVVG